MMPNAVAQFFPAMADYLHDISLGQSATAYVHQLLSDGARLSDAVRGVADRTRPAYRDDPRTIWEPRSEQFISGGDAAFLISLRWR
jgi:hypothetical protein